MLVRLPVSVQTNGSRSALFIRSAFRAGAAYPLARVNSMLTCLSLALRGSRTRVAS